MVHPEPDCIRVLHVDDEPAVTDLSAEFLPREDDRFEVEAATSASEGLERLTADRIDCVVSDYEMPGRSGIEFLDEVRHRYPDLPFVLFTGEGSEAVASEAISAGVSDYLQKETGTEQYEILANRVRNLVEQARMQRALKEREAHLKQAQTIADFGSWYMDVPADDIYWSAAVADIFGVDDVDFPIGHERFKEYVHPKDRDFFEEAWTDALDGATYDVEFRIVRGDGETRWVRERADVEFDADGSPTAVIGVVQDIDERKVRERQLTALNDVAVDLNAGETVDEICERTIAASEEILEFDMSVIDIEQNGYLHKRAISEDIPPENTTSMPVEEGISGRTYRTGESILMDDVDEYDEADPQGPFESGISVPIGEHGVFQAVAETRAAFDETDLELAELLVSHTESALSRLERERRLERQNERLEEVTRVVSHDLQNPLQVANTRLAMARDERDSDHLAEVAHAHDRMRALIDDLLTLARTGDRVTDARPVDLATVAADGWRTVATADATLVTDTARTIRADPERVQQLLENLFGNAVDHGGRDVTVTVGDLADGFFVEDDGSGLPHVDDEQLFESGYTTASEGTGFGLAIVNQVVRAHDWEVDATNGADGGARFEITGVDVEPE